METETALLATAIVGLITTLIVGFITIWKEVRGVHRIINSRMDELLELTRKTAHAAGMQAEKEKDDNV